MFNGRSEEAYHDRGTHIGRRCDLLTSTAVAGIVCQDEYQVVNGQEINTPYCADRYLAKVARERGWNVTFEKIRRQHDLKEEICASIGSDIRIQHNCIQYLDRGHGND